MLTKAVEPTDAMTENMSVSCATSLLYSAYCTHRPTACKVHTILARVNVNAVGKSGPTRQRRGRARSEEWPCEGRQPQRWSGPGGEWPNQSRGQHPPTSMENLVAISAT